MTNYKWARMRWALYRTGMECVGLSFATKKTSEAMSGFTKALYLSGLPLEDYVDTPLGDD